MSVELAIGVDIGTTHTKAIAFDPATRRRVGFGHRATTWTHYPDGRVETSGDTFVADVRAAIGEAVAAAESQLRQPICVTGIGLTGLAESGVVIDSTGQPLTPAIAWFDNRGEDELAALSPEFLTAFPARTGLPVRSQWSFAKLLWFRAQGLELTPGHRWLNIPEYIAYVLTGEIVTELSLASRTALLDQATGTPWLPALARLGTTESLLPALVRAGDPAGRVTGDVLPPGALVTVVGHDHPVAAIGAGAIGGDQLFNSSGTADVVLRSVGRVLTDTEREQLVAGGVDAGRHVLPGRSALIGGVRAGLVLRRVLSLLGRNDPAARDELDRRWRPDTPIGSLRVRGAHGRDNDVTIVLQDGASPDAAWAAALQHTGAETADLLAVINRVVGEHRSAVAAGGWTRLRSIRATKSQVIPSLTFSAIDEPGALGAALFAAWAAAGTSGEFADLAASIRPATTAPDAGLDRPTPASDTTSSTETDRELTA